MAENVDSHAKAMYKLRVECFPGDAILGWVDSPLRDLTVLSAGSHAGSSPGFLVGAERGGTNEQRNHSTSSGKTS